MKTLVVPWASNEVADRPLVTRGYNPLGASQADPTKRGGGDESAAERTQQRAARERGYRSTFVQIGHESSH